MTKILKKDSNKENKSEKENQNSNKESKNDYKKQKQMNNIKKNTKVKIKSITNSQKINTICKTYQLKDKLKIIQLIRFKNCRKIGTKEKLNQKNNRKRVI